MKSILKMGVWIAAFFLLLGVGGMAQAQTELKQLGRNPFFKPELQTVGDFQEMVKQALPDLKKGFTMAGAAELFDDFVIQVDQSNIETVDVPIGEKLQWMIYRKAQRVEVMKDMVWAGKEPFKAFRLAVDQNGNRNIFVVPLICGNVALARTTAVPAPTPVVMEKPAPVVPPVVAAPAPVKAMDPAPLTVDAEPALRRGQLVADIGFLHQPDPANYLLFRIGYDYRFHENYSVLGMIGFAPVIRGHDDTDSVMADLTAYYHFDRMHFGGGLGLWHSSRKDRADLIVNAGYRIYGEAYQRNVSLFLEARAAVDELNELEKYIRYGGGVRVHF
jgi:hypothetical protein